MSSHLLVLDGPSSGVRRSGAVQVHGLDAWLGTGADPVQDDLATGTDLTPGGSIVDWSAPCWDVNLTYDTADTAQTSLPSGVRPILKEGSRRLMFDVQAYEILVRVTSHRLSEQHLLDGQVLFEGLPLPGVAVRLATAGPEGTVLTDRSGSFRLPPLAHGAYGLQIAVKGVVLAVPPIALH